MLSCGPFPLSAKVDSMARLLILLLAISTVTPALAFTADRLSFAVRVRDEVSSHRVLGVFVLPEEDVQIEVLGGSEAAGGYRLEATAGIAQAVRPGRWTWRAPAENGLHPLKIVNALSREVRAARWRRNNSLNRSSPICLPRSPRHSCSRCISDA